MHTSFTERLDHVGTYVLVAAVAVALLVTGCSGGTASTSAATDAGEPQSSDSASAAGSTDLSADIEVDGRRIHVTCLGPSDGTAPTVLFEAGLDEPSAAWNAVAYALSPTRRVCAYDRAGTGASSVPPKPRRTSKDLVADLEAVLEGAEIAGSFVLVGHSMGAWPLSLYAAAHPEEVAGVVLVDPRGSHVSAQWLAALPPPATDEPESVRLNREELTDFEHDPSLNNEHLDLATSATEASALLDASGPLFGDVPVLVLGAANTHLGWSDLPPNLAKKFDSIWLGEQKALAAESSNGAFEMVADSGHGVQVEKPQAVIDAIESVLADVSG
jgi:pimeloyl-ACP methyl ester carboxylesterase